MGVVTWNKKLGGERGPALKVSIIFVNRQSREVVLFLFSFLLLLLLWHGRQRRRAVAHPSS